MTEIKRDLHEDLKIMTLITKDPDEPVDMVHDVVTPHALRRAIAAEDEVGRLRKALEEARWYLISIDGRYSPESAAETIEKALEEVES